MHHTNMYLVTFTQTVPTNSPTHTQTHRHTHTNTHIHTHKQTTQLFAEAMRSTKIRIREMIMDNRSLLSTLQKL